MTDLNRSLFLLLTTLLLLGISTTFLAICNSLDGRSPLVITRDEASEVLELIPLIIHGASTQGERSNELGQSKRSLVESLLSKLSQHVLARLLD